MEWIFSGILALAILATALYLFAVAPRSSVKRPDASFLKRYMFAHRGLYDNSNGIPENSTEAFRRAVSAGYGIEFDIHVTKDLVPVVFHDDTLTRMCVDNSKPEDLTLEQIRRLSLLGTEYKVPTLEEVLSIIDGKVPFIAEIKSLSLNTDSVCCESDRLLCGYKGLYCVESFNPIAMRWYKKHRPDILRGQLSSSFMKYKESRSFKMFLLHHMLLNFLSRPDFIAYDMNFPHAVSLRTSTMLFDAIPVAWTVRSEKELRTAKKVFEAFIFENFRP